VSHPDPIQASPKPSKTLRLMSGFAALLWWASVAMAGLMALAWIAIYGLIVPRIGEFRPMLENKLSSSLGMSLRIGQIQAHINGVMPTFEMTQVRLLDTQGRDALVLQKVTAALSPKSLLDWGFDQLIIERPEIAVRRNAAGRISVAGLDMDATTPNAGESHVAADWFFSQREFIIKSGTIRWTDELRGAASLALSGVDLHVRNSGRKHLLRIDATPAPQWGERLTLMGDFRGPLFSAHPGDWRGWEGQLHANLPRVDVRELKKYADLGVDVEQGRGSLRGWIALDKGKIVEATADMGLADVNIRLRQDLAPLAMSRLSGRVAVTSSDKAFVLRTEQLAFQLLDGLTWPGGNLRLALSHHANPAQALGELAADKLDLAALAQISDRLPLDATAHGWLRALQPQGQIPSLQAKWQGPYSQPNKYEVQGQAVNLSILASAITSTATSSASGSSRTNATTTHTSIQTWHPGARGADIEFKLNEKNGQAKLRIQRGNITLPGIFEEPTVPLESLSGLLNWQVEGDQWQIQLADWKFSNSDVQGEGRARWSTSDPLKSASKSRFPGLLDLQGTLARAEGTKVHRYLPLFIAREARHYVRDAVLQGKVSSGSFKVKGDLFDMPFTDPAKGEFRIATKITDVILDYVPKSLLAPDGLPWPALIQINGELVFDRVSMAVKDATARVDGAPSLQLSRTDALIADLTQQQTVVIQTDAKGSAADVLGLINSSPLSEISSKALARATITGNADVKLRLQLPLGDLQRSRVLGSVTLADSDFQFSPDASLLQQTRGVIAFSEKGFTLRDTSARGFGGEFKLEGGSRSVSSPAEASVALRAQGIATAEGLRQARELGYLSRLAEQASGSAAYVATLNVRSGIPEVSVSSSLQGLALNLPQPLRKTAETALPMRYENTLIRESLTDGRAVQDQVVLELGSLGSVNYLRDVSGAVPRVIRGRIGVGLSPGESIAGNDNPGVVANINFVQLDLDAWEKLLNQTTSASVTKGTAPAEPAATLTDHTGGYLPSVMSVRARELTVQGRVLNNVVVGGSRQDLTWRANLDARELNGYLEYRQPSANNSGRVFARLARLSLAASTASELEIALDEQPSSIPALDIVVEDFELRGKRLGRIEVEALNRDAGGVREWRLSKLNMILPEAQFSATGNWTLMGATGLRAGRVERRRTALNFKLDITDSGELLKRFGQDKTIARGKGRMEGQIAWQGAPWALDYGTLGGGFNVNVEAGQFLKADPGLAKLLGVLSLQSLPRRLSLDFRDVFSEGFQFDFIRGDVKIEQGVAFTNNLQMKGVNAAVLMEGSANIAKETQDIKVVVVPEINAGTASLVATVINPAIGLGTFLAQLILRRPFIEAATQEFHIDGSWAEPQIVRVKRRPSGSTQVQPNESESTTK
jgi:uncharacterized protein (TIGR02099 family)